MNRQMSKLLLGVMFLVGLSGTVEATTYHCISPAYRVTIDADLSSISGSLVHLWNGQIKDQASLQGACAAGFPGSCNLNGRGIYSWEVTFDFDYATVYSNGKNMSGRIPCRSR